MAQASRPTAMMTAHLTKEQKAQRQEQEEKLQGNATTVYRVPKDFTGHKAQVYKSLVKELKATGILNNLDIELLKITVDSMVGMHEIRQELDRIGYVAINSKKLQTAYKECFTQYAKCIQELGLSPSARARLATINIQTNNMKDDPLLKVLGKNK